MFYRHGDILIREAKNKIDENSLKKISDNILAEGEETGHHHRMHKGQVLLFKESEAQQEVSLMKVQSSAELVHEEHKALEIPKGDYQIVRERTFNIFENVVEQARD